MCIQTCIYRPAYKDILHKERSKLECKSPNTPHIDLSYIEVCITIRTCNKKSSPSIQIKRSPVPRYHVPCTCYGIAATRYLIQDNDMVIITSGTWYQVYGARYLVDGTRYLIQGTVYPVPGPRYLAPGRVTGTWYKVLIPGNWYIDIQCTETNKHSHFPNTEREHQTLLKVCNGSP